MTYHGHIKNGAVVLDDPVKLPEGAEVRVDVVPEEPQTTTLGQKLMKYAGKAQGLPPDASRNIDHYLYGLPKK